MDRNDVQVQRKRLTVVLSLTIVLCAGLIPQASAGNKRDSIAKKDVQLVWPLPPDKPRIKFIGSLYGASDVEPVKKANFLDKVAGIEKKSFKPSFIKPYGIATDSKNRIYVSDSGQGIVFVFDREQKKVTYIGRTTQVRLKVPLGITVDSKDRLWVADSVGQHVYAFDTDGNVLAALGKEEEMINPTGVAMNDKLNRLYVVDSKQHCILVYNPDTGELLKKIGKRGSDKVEFNYPTHIAIDNQGQLYVTDTLNFRIQILTPDGIFIAGFGGHGNKLGQFMKPKGIAMDRWDNVYVVDSDFCNFQAFDKDSHLLMPVGGMGFGPGQLWLPNDIYVARNNTVYVSDQNNSRIQMFQLVNGETDEADRTALKATEKIKDPTKSQ